MILGVPRCPFTWDEAEAAHKAWGLNCGPSALACVLGLKLDAVLPHLGDFKAKGYMSPTMMADAMRSLGVQWIDRRGDASTRVPDAFPSRGLVRVQWTGPWTAPGANPRWAYGHTHWIATWQIWHSVEQRNYTIVFDINGGMMMFEEWLAHVVPMLTPKRGYGGWYPTHLWKVTP